MDELNESIKVCARKDILCQVCGGILLGTGIYALHRAGMYNGMKRSIQIMIQAYEEIKHG